MSIEMKINGKVVLSGLGEASRVSGGGGSSRLGRFVELPREVIDAGGVSGVVAADMRACMTLRFRDGMFYFMRPHVSGERIEPFCDGQYFLWQRHDGLWGLMLPLVDGDVRASLESDGDGTLSLRIAGSLPGQSPERAVACFVALGRDPYKLTRDAMRAVQRRLCTFRLREDKAVPSFWEHWGWCTWDAFYGDVTEEKVLTGLRAFQDGLMPGFVILDDGWEQRDNEMLVSMQPDEVKFPRGIAPLVERAKNEFGVKCFGLHLILVGFWSGVSPNGPLAKEYTLVPGRECIRPWEGPEAGIRDLSMIVPGQAGRFWREFASLVRSWGVDMIKVDGQSGLHLFCKGAFGRGSTMAAYQNALQTPASECFGGNLLHCMCHGSDVAYHMRLGNLWRASNDYFPNRPESHGAHLQNNALNSMWISTFAFCDWDMFWSRHPQGPFHAAARAISGGPVYVSDCPGESDFDLIRKLTITDGRVLRCPQPALPARDCLLRDACQPGGGLLKVTNRNGPAGVMGLFNCRHDAEIEDTFTAADFPDKLPGRSFALWLHNQQRLLVVRPTERLPLRLAPLEFEVAHFVPIRQGLACLGLLDKFNAIAATAIVPPQPPSQDDPGAPSHSDQGVLTVHLLDGGRVGFYCAAAPQEILVNDLPTECPYDYNATTKLLTLTLPPGQSHNIRIKPRRGKR